MGDAADMLGISGKGPKVLSAAEEAAKLMLGKPKIAASIEKKVKKPKGMKREVFDLIGDSSVTTAVQASAPLKSAGFKSKRVLGTEGKWTWAPIESSARSDGFKSMYHWIRADKFYSDYPYAQFNVKLDKVTYTDELYTQYLEQPGWNRADTDTLMDYCYCYDLRWPVIVDRIELSEPKTCEELQARYCFVASTLANIAPSNYVFHLGVQPFKNVKYDLEVETSRRKRQEHLLNRTREEEQEEAKLREELKLVNEQIRKIKKVAKASSSSASRVKKEASAEIDIDEESNVQDALTGEAKAAHDYLIAGKVILDATTTAPITTNNANKTLGPQPGCPCLQSSRLYMTSAPPEIGTSAVIKMHEYLRELHIPERPVPTGRVCDLVDVVRYDAQMLIALHKIIQRKQRQLNGEEEPVVEAVVVEPPVLSSSTVAVKMEKMEKNPKPRAPRNRQPKSSTSVVAVSAAVPAVKNEVIDNIPPVTSILGVIKAPPDNLVDLLDVFSPAVDDTNAMDIGEEPELREITSIAPSSVLSGFTGSMLPPAPVVKQESGTKKRGKKAMT